MGNTCATPRRKGPLGRTLSDEDPGPEQSQEDELETIFYGTQLHFLPYNERRAQLEEWLTDIQTHNRERLRKEMLTDLHSFILSNVLLCVQFYENFDSAAAAAKDFKQKTEAEMTAKLEPMADDGMILGERKCRLIHGMGQQISKNYIYRDDGYLLKGKSANNAGREGRKKVSMAPAPERAIGESDEARSTFSCDNILPLEFVITWDNLEVFKESEWDGLREYQYSSAKGSPSICRVCMEETDEKNKIPRGFVRVRVVDTPLSLRPGHPLPIQMDQSSASPSGSVGYATGDYTIANGSQLGNSEEFNETVHEVQTESDLATSSSEDDNSHSDISSAFVSGIDFLNDRRSRLESYTSPIPKISIPNAVPPPTIETSRFRTPNLRIDGLNRGLLATQGYNDVIGELSQRINVPKFTLSTSSPPNGASRDEASPAEFPSSKAVSHRFETNVSKTTKNNRLLKPSSAAALRKRSRSLPSVAPPAVTTVVQTSSSGYDSASPTPPPVSRTRSNSTSIASDDIRNKWQQVELKRLWQFLPKRRHKAPQPLSESCFQKIQIEVESDEDDVLELESDNSEDDTDSDVSSTDSRPKKALSEPKYEHRTYLNSVGFSADFCSEFKQIGTELQMGESPLRSAVVLGTTVRCAVATPVISQAEDNAKASTSRVRKRSTGVKNSETAMTLQTFTPSLHSKNWPQKPLIWWKGRMLHDAWEGSEKWPTAEQVDQIEQAGCNLIPLGNRSINSTQSENVQQTLVWSIGFAASETILLDSLLHVQWRCLNFAAVIFRAFLAPLGPLGVGPEHLRNILYFMCHEEFVSWNYEQPGLHLKAFLDRLYDCLGRGDMPNFFIPGHNMFKNIPVQNLRKVQAYLSKVRDNLLFYTIFMVRNLVQVNKDFYPMPRDHFEKLYQINPVLADMKAPDLHKESKKAQKKREKKELNQALLMNGELIDNAFEEYINKGGLRLRHVDHEQRRLRRRRERWLDKQQKIKEQEEAEAWQTAESGRLPQEKNNSIDLEETPLKPRQFSAQRLGLVLKYFIKHFIKMSAKSYKFKSYAQASMYCQHVENLISLLCELPNEDEDPDTQKFKADSTALRDTIGTHMIDYIQEKISLMGGSSADEGATTKTFDQILGLVANPGSASGPFSNNWELRTLPTPPGSEIPKYPKAGPSAKPMNLSSQHMARSLASLSVSSLSQMDGQGGGSSGEFHLPRLPVGNFRRGPGIKWTSNPAIPPSSTIYLPKIPSEAGGGNFTFGYPVDRH